MTIRYTRRRTSAERQAALKNHLRNKRKGANRSLNHEQLESRQLMAADIFQLIGIQNNDGDLLDAQEVLNSAPQNLTLRFDENHAVDPATLAAGIRIYRAGANNVLDGGIGDDIDILGNGADFGGFIGIGDSPNEVVIRFGEALADDQYRIEISSSLMGVSTIDGAVTAAVPFSSTFELNLGAQILSIVPQPVTRNATTGALEIARDQIYIYMNDDDLDMALATDPGYYQLLFQRTSTDPNNDGPSVQNGEVAFFPEKVEYNPTLDRIILTFGDSLDELPKDLPGFEAGKPTVFRLQIGSKEITSKEWTNTLNVDTIDAITNDAGDTFETATPLVVGPNAQSLLDGNHEFEVTRAAHIDSNGDNISDVLHQIFTIDDGFGTVITFELTDATGPTNPNTDYAIVIPAALLNPLTPGTRADLATVIRDEIVIAFGGTVTVSPSTSSVGGTRFALTGAFGRPTMEVSDTTVGLIVDRSQTIVIHGQITNEPGQEYGLDLPGASDEPGHREDYLDQGQQQHLTRPADNHNGITEFRYAFPNQYGVDPATGAPLFNQITEAQKQRTREIMSLYSYYAGVTFVEVPFYEPFDLGIVTGDMRAVNPDVPTGPGAVAGIQGGNLAIMDIFDHQNAGDDEYGAAWQTTAIHEIGHFLGLGHAYELPPVTDQSGGDNNFGLGAENIFPGDHDIVHMQHLYNPESKDIDLYKLEITETGRLTAEILAERLSRIDPNNPNVNLRDPSSLDALITIYQENGDGTRTVIARNDDYYSEDSFVELLLQQGTYYIGVSASGNNAYDPSIPDSGFGGKSQGDYDLQIRFRPDSTNAIRDTGAVLESGASIQVRNAAEDFGTAAQLTQSGLHTITVVDAIGTSMTYELDFVTTLGVPPTVVLNNVPVQVLNTALASDIVAALVAAINATPNFAVVATNVGNRIDLANVGGNDPVDFSALIDTNDTMRVSGGASGGVAIDGDLDGAVGGNYNFWFRAETPNDTATPPPYDEPVVIYVDKTATRGGLNNPPLDGSLQRPFNNIQDALALADLRSVGDVIRIIGLAGVLDDPTTLADNLAYYIGYDTTQQQALEDGRQLIIPQGVTVMIDEGAILKFGVGGAIIVGSTSVNEDRSFAALQVLGIPERFDPYVNSANAIVEDTARANKRVIFTSYNEDGVGSKSNTQFTPSAGDWGGILFNNEVDRQQENGAWQDKGIFLNSVVGGDFRYAGGISSINGEQFTLAPVYMEETRPALYFNQVVGSAGAAFSADPNSFEKTNFQVYTPPSIFDLAGSYRIGEFNAATPDYTRSGPAIFGNDFVTNELVSSTGAVLREGYDTNSLNGIAIRINTPAGNLTEKLTVTANFDDTDIVHVLLENLLIEGTPGGLLVNTFGRLTARLDAGLVIDPNIVIKSNGSRIEVQMGASLIAEAKSGNEIIFTSLHDDRYGFGGTFDTNGNGTQTTPQEGDWSGIYFGQTATGSLDHAVLAFGGGNSRVDGGLAFFNVIEVHQATVRVANSLFEENADGMGVNDPGPTRAGHSANATGTIFVAGAQPVIVSNNFRNNESASVNINVNSLNSNLVVDWGRSTGLVDITPGVGDNQGALVRFNLQTNNGVNGMIVRGGVLTTQSVWDDTDIVHVLFSEVVIPDLHTYGGLRIESSTKESLVVKLFGANAGITASGTPLDIEDRVGGMLQVIGQPGFPVVFTSYYDDTVGAGFDENGMSSVDTDNNGSARVAAPGDWRSLLIDENANDRNVEVIVEAESNNAVSVGTNGSPQSAQAVGILAPDEYAGDDNRRLGFEIQGYLSSPSDVDVYSFQAVPGTEVWLDLDRTTMALDAIIELIDEDGNVIARSIDNDTLFGNNDAANQLNTMPKSGAYDQDRWTINPRDASMRIVLPGNPASSVRTYHVRIRSNSDDIGTTQNSSGSYLVNQEQLTGGLTSGVYQLQIRLREIDEFGGSTIKQADVRYATNGIEVLGQPAHSPLLAESAEDGVDNNNSLGNAHNVGNVLTTDRDAISIAGNIAASTDVDWFRFELTRELLQSIDGFSADSLFASLMIDIDYMGGARGNSQIAVYDEGGQLVLVSSDSGVNDDQTQTQFVANSAYDPDYTTLADQTRGSLSTNDPYIGTIQVPQGVYYVAVSSNAQISNQLTQFYQENPTNPLVRLEPVDSIRRIVEDHISGNSSGTAGAPDITAFLRDEDTQTVDYHLSDMVLFVSVDVGDEQTQIWAINPFTGAVEAYIGQFAYDIGDIGMRPDGSLYAYSIDNIPTSTAPSANENGNFIQIDTATGQATFIRDDGLQTYVTNPADGKAIVDHPIGNTRVGYGYDFNALAYGYLPGENGNASRIVGYVVGDYAGPGNVIRTASTDGTNILFRADASDTDTNGVPLGSILDFDRSSNDGPNDTTNAGRANGIGGTDARAVGQIDTFFDAIGADSSTVIFSAATEFDQSSTTVPQALLNNFADGDTFVIQAAYDHDMDPMTPDLVVSRTIELNMGYDLAFAALNRSITQTNVSGTNVTTRSGGTNIAEGLNFTVGLDTYSTVYDQFIDFSGAAPTATDNGSVIEIDDVNGNKLFLYLNDIAVNDPSIGLNNAISMGYNAGSDTLVAISYNSAGGTTADSLVNSVLKAIADNSLVNNPNAAFTGTAYRSGTNVAVLNDQTIIIKGAPLSGNPIGFGGAIVNEQNVTPNNAVVIDIAATETELATAVAAAINTVTPGSASQFETRVTVQATAANFAGLGALVVATADGTTNGANLMVNIGAGSTDVEIANAIATAVNAGGSFKADSTTVAGRIHFTFTPDATAKVQVIDAADLLEVGGLGSGGSITGLAMLQSGVNQGELYAVDDNGGVFYITNPNTNPNTAPLITDFLGQFFEDDLNSKGEQVPVRFVSLEAGPRTVDSDTRYNNILFAMSDRGVMYAITITKDAANNDTAELAPIFFGGRTHIATAATTTFVNEGGATVTGNIGTGNITGVAMGTLNRNLWNVTDTFANSAGHGINVPITSWRDGEVGGNSFYFGNEQNTFTGGNAFGNATTNNYDFPQGAHGSIISNAFSLDGYDATDLPVLYFNYFSESDNVNGNRDNATVARDTFRVFIAGNGGNWVELSTNNSAEGGTPTFDNTGGWRQARIDLSQFAGQENLKLRFDFATGGQVNVGGVAINQNNGASFNANTTEIRAVDYRLMHDGEIFSITDPYTNTNYRFEIDKGQTFTFGTASQFVDGDKFTLYSQAFPGTPYTFEFDKDGDVTLGNIGIVLELTDTPETIAEKVRQAIEANMLNGMASTVRTFRDGNELTVRDIDFVDRDLLTGKVRFDAFSTPIVGMDVEGSEGLNDPTRIEVDLHDRAFVTNDTPDANGELLVDDVTIARILQFSFQHAMAPGGPVTTTIGMGGIITETTGTTQIVTDPTVTPGNPNGTVTKSLLYTIVPRHDEFVYMLGGYQVFRGTASFGLDTVLDGDINGVMQDFLTDGDTLLNVFSTNTALNHSRERGAANTGRGIFIDDLIIGFAERGEMVTGATNNGTGFTNNPFASVQDIFVGQYQLELREGTEYVRNGIVTRVWDTNARFLQGTSVYAPAGTDLPDNSRLEISDGVDTIVFRFYDLDQVNAVTPTVLSDRMDGVYSIPYRVSMTKAEIAGLLTNAINDTVGQRNRSLTESTRTFGVIARVNSTLAGGTTSGQIDLSPKSPYSDTVLVGNVGELNLGALPFTEVKTDTFATATNTKLDAATIPGRAEFHARGKLGDNTLAMDPMNPLADWDVDMYRVELGLNSTIQVDVDALSLGSKLKTLVRLFFLDDMGVMHDVISDDGGGTADPSLIYTVTNPSDVGRYVVAISHMDNANYDPTIAANAADPGRITSTEKGLYSLAIGVSNGGQESVADTASANPTFLVRTWNLDGDQNNFRDQGQIIISSNRISNSSGWGVLVDAAPRGSAATGGDNLPHQGAASVTFNINTARLATGVVIVNNIIYDNGTGAILFSGDQAPTSQTQAAVPVGRILNNTLYGTGVGDVGIQVDNQAGPSIVNNIVANFATGISVANDGVSQAQTRISRTLFQGNGLNSNFSTGQTPVLLNPTDVLFVNAAAGNFYLAAGSQAIDAAFDSVPDRSEFNTLNSPLGIATSPVIAPARDQSGQLRYDDPTVASSGGVGNSSFKDIGALDRADTRGPSGTLIDPQDNDAANLDLDQTPDVVQLLKGPLTNISIQLIDSSGLSSQPQGSGIDDTTVTSNSFFVERISGGVVTLLEEGVDYRFDYDATNNVIRLTPVSGVFEEEVTYKITLKNRFTIDPLTGMALGPLDPSLIRDNAGNSIEPNKFTGNETSFFIRVGGLLDFGDAPDSIGTPGYGTLVENDGARHGIREGFFLGEGIDSELNGKPSDGATGDNFDDGIAFGKTSTTAGTGVITRGSTSIIYVEATVPLNETNYGFIQAWLDYDGNGMFDANEMVLDKALNSDAIMGANLGLGQQFAITGIPIDAITGQTYMRFRYSSTGGLSATGLAEDGEVEDYEVTIEAATPNPWHNALKPAAVTPGDNVVTSHDLAAILYEMQYHQYTDVNGKFLPAYDPYDPNTPFVGIGGVPGVVPNYLDVYEDGYVNATDYLLVLDYFVSNQFQLSPESVEDAMLSSSSETVNPAVENAPLIDSSTSSVQIVTSEAPSYTMTSTPLTASSSTISSNPISQPTIDLFGLSIQQSKPSVATFSQSTSATASYDEVDESFTDEVLFDDSIDAVLISVADDVNDTWRIDTEDSDDMEDLIALISQGEE